MTDALQLLDVSAMATTRPEATSAQRFPAAVRE
jgi:hypothetical protein